MAAPPVQGAMSNMEGRVVEFLRSLSADLLAQSPVHRKSITLGARN